MSGELVQCLENGHLCCDGVSGAGEKVEDGPIEAVIDGFQVDARCSTLGLGYQLDDEVENLMWVLIEHACDGKNEGILT